MHASPLKPLALIILALAIALAGCTPTATPVPATQAPVEAPTMDVQVIQQTVQAAQTMAVETAMAQLTANAPVATETSAPTATQAATEAATIPPLPSSTPVPALPTNTFVPFPTITRTTSPYACDISKLNPKWNVTMKPGTDFDLNVTMENTGVNKWDENSFDFRYSSGTKFGAASKVLDLPKTVKPGGTVQFIVDMTAPADIGLYKATWVLSGDGFSACSVTIQIETTK